jgi:hypothetical protein
MILLIFKLIISWLCYVIAGQFAELMFSWNKKVHYLYHKLLYWTIPWAIYVKVRFPQIIALWFNYYLSSGV